MQLTDPRPPIRAAQYLRMSTEQQPYSPDNQRLAIARYARERGYEVVETYIDAGKSGLSLRGRDGLKQLLADAVSGNAGFNAILVLDVSRWGRFQDVDQGSHYEFQCRSAGVPIYYVAEPFEQDGSMASSLLKQLKRVMAGEASRELSVKVTQAHNNYAIAGYLQGGMLTYGVRRLVLDEQGNPKGVLAPGERKGFRAERVVPIPGPKGEIAVINRIYKLYVAGKSHRRIAEILNADGVPATRGAWTHGKIAGLLHNDLVLGRYVYNRTTRKLQAPLTRNSPDQWIVTQVFAPLVDPRIVRLARETPRQGKANIIDDRRLLRDLRKLYEKHGRLSGRLIKAAPQMAHPKTYQNHFGSLEEAYRLVGYETPNWIWNRINTVRQTPEEILRALKQCYDDRGYINAKLINAERGVPSVEYLKKAFGSLPETYRMAGIPYSDMQSSATEGKLRHYADRRAAKT
ncbi:recombinase family protein [Caulobacter sp. B11]|uniref:recombinase family protein n=1 Tax=Caulobacter sp. B11 TaxID=2048899 RepID=UPI000C12AC69|nr:recombinase family protein [Caulobacter sp. B11]PHY14154.1 recombinase family protein [Caulobacter sp. B11]